MATTVERVEKFQWGADKETLYFSGLKKVRSGVSVPPPGPPIFKSVSRRDLLNIRYKP
jgi:hypothetical protein